MQDLAFGAMGGGGGVRVEDEPPAPAVDADVVVELAHQDAVSHGGLAAVLFVAQVVHIAVGRPALAAGPFAVPLGAQLHGSPDDRGDAIAAADVQDDGASVP